MLNDEVCWEPDDVPITPADELAIKLPDDDLPKAKCYINAIFNTFLE
jgi:hypothetical protein